jgi:hypothetical protein
MSTSIKQAMDEFLLSCKVEGKSYGTIECYSDKLKGFLWYATNYDWPDDIRLSLYRAMLGVILCFGKQACIVNLAYLNCYLFNLRDCNY